MLINHRNKTTPNYRLLLLTIVGLLTWIFTLSHADEIVVQKTSQFDRSDVEIIRMHTRQILSDPAFASIKTFRQWLVEKFSKWKGPDFDLGSGWATFIWSIILIWCVLTLLAILAHLIWTIRLLIRPNTHWTNSTADSESNKVMSFEELLKIAKELAKKGAFSEAISAMILGLLRWLDSMETIRFHESKTNGDYVREYPSSLAGRDEFKKFVALFERTIYGSVHSNRQTYLQMSSLMEYIRNSVTQKA